MTTSSASTPLVLGLFCVCTQTSHQTTAYEPWLWTQPCPSCPANYTLDGPQSKQETNFALRDALGLCFHLDVSCLRTRSVRRTNELHSLSCLKLRREGRLWASCTPEKRIV